MSKKESETKETKPAEPVQQRRLVASEYIGARYMFAAAHALDSMTDQEKRWRLTKDGWRYYKTAMAMLTKALEEYKKTIPEEGKRHLQNDLRTSRLKVHTATISNIKVDDTDMVFATRNQMQKLMNYATEGCALCALSGEDVVKCKKRKLLHELINFDVPIFKGDACSWADWDVDTVDSYELTMNATWEDIDRDREKSAREAGEGSGK